MARCVCAVLCYVLLLGCESRVSPPAPEPSADAQFAGGGACASCHADVATAWRDSHHAKAMQPANDATVLGNFDSAQFEYNGVVSRFFKRGEAFWLNTDGADGNPQDFQVAYTFGVEPLQQYLVALPAGKLQALSIAWDARTADEGGQRWFHLYPDQNVDFRDPLHWTGMYQNWNTMCAECHSTDLNKNYRLESDSYETSWTSLSVDCEACHGPGSLHVEAPTSHKLALAALPRQWIFEGENNTARRMPETPERRELETCAQCHARRSQVDEDFLPGHALLDSFRPALLDAALYHADGQILDEVYVYGSFLQSAMHSAGVTCSDCHEPHTAKLRFAGNALCAQCHLPSAFERSEHHGHEPGSTGAQCIACHMPEKTYMVVDPRRDHSFRIPRPDLSAALDAPNACTQCHSDRSAAWASEHIAAWPNTHRNDEFHFGAALASGRNWQVDRSPQLLQVLNDDNQTAIARASALSVLSWQYSDTLLSAVERGLSDDSPLVQLAALDALSAVPAEYRVTLAQRFLDAPLKSQRLAAARGLASHRAELSPQRQSDLDAAIEEYVAAQRFNGDRPEGWFNLAVLYAELGRRAEAQALLETAIERAPEFTASYVNLADLYRNRGAEDQALALLERAAADYPADAGIALALGLSLVRADRATQAEAWLRTATQLAPDSPYYAYVYGIALHSAGDINEALQVLSTAQLRFPGYAELALALATIQRDRGEAAAALDYAQLLQQLLPTDPRARSLVDELSRGQQP